ncbi:Endonuclease/Exonuclease/phosphatase family protein [Tritrichomonas foetus]|uniref:Endonuclease/Exonuclease/phosphatase family protein n=1 Tax=Tritrichomonas foetus TaxID=1144522 RepID=A0A1J4KQV4_9EUKA|nr:Endonuclease/Exonuclease/phosphatase family protein [Tritrichomonas foetus]|eukprot:OHT13312.1 Endonuclease/Exonuclease/phosphatase family protein [Tritrichomonas foetus]
MLSEIETVNELPNYSIDYLMKKCGPWVNCRGILAQNNQIYSMKIVLQNNTITNAFLHISNVESNQECLFVPITRLILLRFTSSQLMLTFCDYDDKSMLFLDDMSNERQFELFISQFHICATLSKNCDDNWRTTNEQFLSKNETAKNIIPKANFIDPSTTSCAISPVIFDENVRNTWMKRSRMMNTSYFTKPVELTICCLTWNVGSGHPNQAVENDLSEVAQFDADIFFFAFQEIDMSFQSIINGKSSKTDEWSNCIANCFADKKNYTIAYSVSLGGVFATAIFKNDSPIPITVDLPKKMRLGLHGMTANKSAIIFPTTVGENAKINFVGCHLSAHQANTEARNQELKSLLNYASMNSDYVVLIGDLNYRINLSYEECLLKIKNNDLDQLFENDQLNQARKIDSELAKFEEGKVSFMPTYKFDKNSDVYDTSPKMRIPSYTDRVLVATSPKRLAIGSSTQFVFETDIIHDLFPGAKGFIYEQRYSSDLLPPNFPEKPKYILYMNRNIQFSDHRPVQGVLLLKVPVVIPEKLEEFNNYSLKKIDEMSSLAKPILEPKSLDLIVGVKKTIEVKFKNVAVSWAPWRVVVDGDEISVSPSSGVLFPEQTGTIYITGIRKTAIASKFQIHGKEKYSRNVVIESSDGIPLCFIQVRVSNKLSM